MDLHCKSSEIVMATHQEVPRLLVFTVFGLVGKLQSVKAVQKCISRARSTEYSQNCVHISLLPL